jgi:aminoglycoside phosphotransferase family enzyme/predicted kinase
MTTTQPDEHPDGALVAQEQLLPFLLDPQSYPHRPKRVRLVQTHASFVFIAPPFVYKVKKAVNFGFLDFSTPAKRLHFCEREVALNRRLAPSTYLGVIPITKHGGHFAFGQEGPAVEYAVQMRQLPDGHFLDQLLKRNGIGPRDLNRIARFLKEFYEAQQPTGEIRDWGRIDHLRISTDENFRQTREFIGHTLSPAAAATLPFYTNRFYARHARLFASRLREGRILDCHGDLHLEHIHLTPGTLQIYDCIEFNDRFRYVDVANDAAFLAMDLDYHKRSDLARQFAIRMARALHDDGMLRLMDFYKCYRACVRGKVESLQSVAHAAPERQRQAGAERARRYFQLALRYAVAGSQPLVLVVMGGIASGKSNLAQALGAELGWEVFASDRLRKAAAGLPLYERSRVSARPQLYSRAMTSQVYQRLLEAATAQVEQGGSVILDATYSLRSQREKLAKQFGSRGVAWCFLEAHASKAAVKQRLRAREASSGEVSDARLEDFAPLTQRYQPPTELPRGHCFRISTTGPLEQSVAKALLGLARLQVDAIT